MADDVTFSAGRADFADRKDLAPWSEDPRAMFRTVAGLAGAPGMAQAGMGMLGGAARAIDPVQRMFSPGGPATGMLASLGVGSAAAQDGAAGRGMDAHRQMALENELRQIEQQRANAAGMSPEQQMQLHQRRIQILRELGKPVSYEKQAGMLGDMMARAPRPRPSGAGERRDRKLRDAEDDATKTG